MTQVARPATSTGIETGAMRMEEFHEAQPALLRDQQVLRLADLRHDAAERRADRRVHHQAAQECAELHRDRSDAAPARLRPDRRRARAS